ncbi:MAG: glycosyltransferase 87 family protein [Segniliparus sp.]|uniref:glycosyltransferase 87 family protein n=1 Tax=Segniliparus sp. TaxID=2804064 RepID=UPI003F304736
MTDTPAGSARVSWRLVGAVAVVAVLALWVQHALIPFQMPWWGLTQNGTDLVAYQNGAQMGWRGQALYDSPATWAGLAHQTALWFIYTPFSAPLFLPISWIHPWAFSQLVWLVLSVVVLALVLRRAMQAAGVRDNRALLALSVILAVAAADLEPVRATLWYGQVNILLMGLILLDLVRPQDAKLRGFGVGVAAGIKLTPLIFLPYLLVTRQWRAAKTAVLVFALTAAIGWAAFPSDSRFFWGAGGQVGPIQAFTAHLDNQSAAGVLARIWEPAPAPSVLVHLVQLAVAVLGLACARRVDLAGERFLALLLVGLTGCAVSPISWTHHWVWFAPFVVWLAAKAAVADKGRAAAFAAAGLVLALFIWTQSHVEPPGVLPSIHLNVGICYWDRLPGALGPIAHSWYLILCVAILIGANRLLRYPPLRDRHT